MMKERDRNNEMEEIVEASSYFENHSFGVLGKCRGQEKNFYRMSRIGQRVWKYSN